VAVTAQEDAIVAEMTDLVRSELTASAFWSGFRAGKFPIEHVRAVFGQYYLWRNVFHRWFGVCIAKSPAFGTGPVTPYILSELAEHIEEEISGDHHGLAVRFLAAIGVTDPDALLPIPATLDYMGHFEAEFLPADRTGEEALAGLAGRELVAPLRNRMTIDAFTTRYGIADGLEFFHLHEELEVEHFRGLWEAIASRSQEERKLVEAAHSEIVAHVRFWDDVSRSIES
jgi:hypothetical protein